MNIAATQYSIATKSFEIYISGCNGNCKGCHNPELRDFLVGEPVVNVINDILKKINDFNDLIESIWILGGEPLDNDRVELIRLLEVLKTTKKHIMLWTRFDIKDIPNEIIKLLDFIKTGAYIESLKTTDNIQYGIQLATSNQKIIKLK